MLAVWGALGAWPGNWFCNLEVGWGGRGAKVGSKYEQKIRQGAGWTKNGPKMRHGGRGEQGGASAGAKNVPKMSWGAAAGIQTAPK